MEKTIIVRSIATKFVIIGIIFLIFIATFTYISFQHTQRTKDTASKINYAGQMRFRIYEIAWLIHRLQRNPENDKITFSPEVHNKISNIDNIIDSLKKGSSKLEISPVSSNTLLKSLDEISHEWNSDIKPGFLFLLDSSKKHSDKSVNLTDLMVHNFVEMNVDRFVSLLEKQYIERVKNYNTFRYYLIGIFLISFASILIFVRREIIKPILKLNNATKAIGDNFDVNVQINNRDEIGDLAKSFTDMSQRLKTYFFELKSSEEKTKRIMEVVPVGIAVTTPDGRVFDCNDTMWKILGCNSKEEAINTHAVDFYHTPEDRQRLLDLLKEDRVRNIEFTLKRKDGTTGTFSVSSTIDKTHAEGDFLVNAVIDISEQKNVFEELQRNKELLAEAQNIAHLGSWQLDLQTNKLEWSDEIFRIFEINPEEFEVSYETFIDTIHPDDRKFVSNTYNESVKNKTPYDIVHRILTRDGNIKHVREQCKTYYDINGKPLRSAGTVQDVSDTIHSELEIQRNYDIQTTINHILNLSLKDLSINEILNKVLEHVLSIPWLSFQSKGAIFLKDRRSGELNMRVQNGIAEPIQKACKTLTPGKCICGRAALTKSVMFVNKLDKQHDVTYDGITPHGHYCIPILVNNESVGVLNVYLREGHIYNEQEVVFLKAVASTLASIIEKRQMEESLVLSENNLQALFNATTDMVLMIEKNGTIVSVNKEIANRFGVTPEEAVGKIIFNLLPPDLVAQRRPHVLNVLQTRQPHRFQDIYKGRYYDNSLYPVYDANDDVRRIAVFSKDITQLKLTEEELKLHTQEFMALADAFNTISAVPPTEDIYEAICNIAIRKFDLRMAWLGIPLKESKEVKPIAWSGFEEGYLSTIKVKFDDSEYGRGPSGMAIKTRHPSINNNIDDEKFRPWKNEALKRDYHSSLAIPLLDSNAEVIGVLNVYSDRTGYFDRKKVHLFTLFANYAAIALENRLIIEGLESKVRERTTELEDYGQRLHKLYEISYASGKNPKEFTKMILNELLKILKVDAAIVGGFSDSMVNFLTVSEPNKLGIKEGMQFPKKDVFCGIVSDEKKPVVIKDALSSDEFNNHPCFINKGIRSYLGVPLFTGEKILGTLCTFSKSPHEYTDYDLILHQLLSKRLEFEFVRERYENRLRNAMMQARSASRAKSDFLANMSHELRTPLNAIIGFSEMIHDGMTGDINEKQKDFLGDIIASAKHLLELINDILDLSKVEAGKMTLDLSECNLNDIAASSMSMFREKALKHNIHTKVEIAENAEIFVADERKIKQVLFNLLSNAFKHTPDKGRVSLSARRLSVKDSKALKKIPAIGQECMLSEYLEITVTDTGPGITSENQKRLFKPFEQLENTYLKKHEGTGLGLALCKKIIELHGGTIWVESEPEKGANFTFVIPFDAKIAVLAENSLLPANMTDQLSRLLTWDYFVQHIGKIMSRYKTSCQHFVVLFIRVDSGQEPLDTMQIARILKQKTRKYEAIAHGREPGEYYIILLDINKDVIDKVSSRIKQAMKKIGYNCETNYLISTDYEDNENEIISAMEQF